MTALSATGFTPTPRLRTPRLRITARGRAVLSVLIAIPLVAAALVFGWGATGADAGSQTVTTDFEYVTVLPGDSLWSIAQSVAPGADPSQVVEEIVSLNRLDAAAVRPGQRVAIPAQYGD